MTDWTHQMADAIEYAVRTVRAKTVVPAERLVWAVGAGLLAGFLAGAAAPSWLPWARFRVLDVYLPRPV